MPMLLNQSARSVSLFLLLALMLLTAGCKGRPETLAVGGYDEAEMEAATARAIREVDAFIAKLEEGSAENYAVKAPIEDDGQVEHFWITDVKFANNQFSGFIGNDPGIVSNVSYGQAYSLGKTEISDWMYMKDGKMYGNYTLRPLLATMPEDEANEIRSIFATP